VDALVSFLTRRARGGVARRDTQVSGDRLRFGRGTDCEVFLSDPRVRQAHAEITMRPAGPHVEAIGDADLSVNGNLLRASTLKVGDTVAIGPYEVAVVAPEGGAELAITVELVRPLTDILSDLQKRSRVSLAGAGLSRRRLSWIGFVAVALLFFVAPVASFFVSPKTATLVDSRTEAAAGGVTHLANASWSSGEISGPHKFFGANCGACHQAAFVMVQDKTCVSCHEGIQHHADPAHVKLAALDETRCASCHQEHMGPKPVTIRSEAFCADCHTGLKAQVPETTLADAGAFGKAHPQFRPTIPVDETGKLERVSLDASPAPAYQSNLKFPHEKHLKKEGVRVPGGPNKKLECASCHVPDSGGKAMLPIAFDTNCAECHQNHFDPAAPEATVPHGDVARVIESLQGFYAAKGLAGGVPDPEAPAAARRVPGTPLPGVETEARQAITQWAAVRAQKAATVVFSDKVCGACHTVKAPEANVDAAGLVAASATSAAGWQVLKVNARDIFMPKAVFSHAKHDATPCAVCHAAETSLKNTDVLMPKIETCISCHGPERAADKVPSTCVTCHGFHNPGLPPMGHPEEKPAQAAMAN
jgi:predicted CXXCH cytochrome family protein